MPTTTLVTKEVFDSWNDTQKDRWWEHTRDVLEYEDPVLFTKMRSNIYNDLTPQEQSDWWDRFLLTHPDQYIRVEPTGQGQTNNELTVTENPGGTGTGDATAMEVDNPFAYINQGMDCLNNEKPQVNELQQNNADCRRLAGQYATECQKLRETLRNHYQQKCGMQPMCPPPPCPTETQQQNTGCQQGTCARPPPGTSTRTPGRYMPPPYGGGCGPCSGFNYY